MSYGNYFKDDSSNVAFHQYKLNGGSMGPQSWYQAGKPPGDAPVSTDPNAILTSPSSGIGGGGGFTGTGATGSFGPPTPAPTSPTAPPELTQDLSKVEELHSIYTDAVDEVHKATGQARDDLMRVAQTARSQINAIYAKWRPVIDQYSITGVQGLQSGDARLAAIQAAAQDSASQNLTTGMRQIDLVEKGQVDQLEHDRRMAELKANYEATSGGGGEKPTTNWAKGWLEGFQNEHPDSSADEQRDALQQALIRQGMDPNEAAGLTQGLFKPEQDSGQVKDFANLTMGQVAARNAARYAKQGGPTNSNIEDGVSDTLARLQVQGITLKDLGMTRSQLKKLYQQYAISAQEQYEQHRQEKAPAKESTPFSWLQALWS